MNSDKGKRTRRAYSSAYAIYSLQDILPASGAALESVKRAWHVGIERQLKTLTDSFTTSQEGFEIQTVASKTRQEMNPS